MKRSAGWLLLLLVSLPAISATDSGPATIGADQYIRGEFSLTRRLNGFEAPLHARGSFLLSPRFGLVWRTRSPVQQTLIFSGSSLYRVTEDNQLQALVSDAEPIRQFTSMLSRLIGGDWHELERRFQISTQATDAYQWRKTLTPRAGVLQGYFRSLRISGDRFVEQLLIRKASAGSDRIEFSNQTLHDGPLPADIQNLFANRDAP